MKRALRCTAVVVVIALVASLAWARQVPKAFAADPGVSEIVNTLDGATNSLQSWTQGLGGVGKLADALPAVQTSPGSALGFSDLLHQWFNNGAKKVAGAASDSDLNIDEDITLGDGRTGHLKTTLTPVTGGKQIDLTISASKTINNAPLSIPVPVGGGSNAPQSSFSSLGGVALKVDATLTFSLVWEQASNTVFIVANGSTPSLAIDASANFPNPAAIDAVKASIGILGVSLDNTDSSLSLAAHFVGTINDPNNDGKLAFNATDGGELAQAGSLAGLVTFGFANPAGALNAHLHLHAAPASTFSLNLPAIDATIDWHWTDLSQPPPAPTASNIDVAGKFLNMSPRDIADGLGQLATSLTMIQRSKSKTDAGFGNIDLPFLKGSLADALQINEVLKSFLKANTSPTTADDPSADPSQAGQPTFTSLQDLLDKLNTDTGLPGGQHLSISDVNYDDSTSKVSFKIELKRDAPVAPIDLNSAASAASGGTGSTYTQTTLTDNSQSWTTDEWKGHHVVSGTSGATVASNDAHTLTLVTTNNPPDPPNPGWSPTVPAAGSPYSISAGVGDVGVAQFGNALETSGKGISQANAVNATAKVTPSYDAHVTLVLDLRPPTLHDPPLEVTNPDGTKTLESSTPTGADRVLVRTSDTDLFHADFPIDANIDLFANAGFLQVELKGAAHICAKDLVAANCSGTPAGHMLQVSFKDNGDINFGELVQKLLNDPASLLDFNVNVGATGGLDASVPQAAAFVSGTPHAGFHWNDLTQTSGSDGPQFDLSQLNPFNNVDFDPSNPKALFSVILKTLQTLDSVLGSGAPGSNASVFTAKIPVVGRSLSDLLKSDESGSGPAVTFTANSVKDSTRCDKNQQGQCDPNGQKQPNAFPQSLVGRTVVVGTQVGVVTTVSDDTLTMDANWPTEPSDGTQYVVRSELDDAISILQASPSDNLQQLITTLNDRFKDSTPLTFAYEDDAKVNNTPSLVVKLDWKRNFSTSAPVSLDFGLPQNIAGVQGSGTVSLKVGGEINLGLVVPLQVNGGAGDGDALQILNTSHISATLDASVTDASLSTNLGPLAIALGDPTGSDKAQAKASYTVDLADSTNDGTAESFSNFFQNVAPAVNQNSTAVDCGLGGSTDLSLCAKLPLYFSTDSGQTYTQLITPSPGHSNEFALRLPKQPQGGADTGDIVDLQGTQIDGHDRLETPQLADITAALQSRLIDFTQIGSIDGFLNILQTSLNTASFGGKLPLIGKDLQQGADFIGNLKAAIDSALAQLPKLDGSTGSVSDVTDWVNSKLKDAIGNQTVLGTKMNISLTADAVCTDTLASVSPAPTYTLTTPGDAGTKDFKYAIASYIKNGAGTVQEGKPSPILDVPDGYDGGLNTTGDSIKVTWTAASGATGYNVYRDDGSGLKFLHDNGNSLTYTDDSTDAPTSAGPQDPANNPKLHDCSYTDFDGLTVTADISQGDFPGGNLDCTNNTKPCLSHTVPLDIGIPGLKLQAENPADGPTVQFGWHFHLSFGITREDGFFVSTDDQPGVPELAVGLNFDLTQNSDLAAQLAFINVSAHNCTNSQADIDKGCGSDGPSSVDHLFAGAFSIDMTSPHNNGMMTVDDIANGNLSDLFKVKLSAEAKVDWLLKAKVGEDAGFPGIQAEFRLHWKWTNADPADAADMNPANGNPTADVPVPLTVSFNNVAIDSGAVFGHILSPIVNEIKKVTGPLDPIIKTLYAPIPVLSDLSHLVGGGDITLVSIAKAFSTIAGGPDLEFIDKVVAVIAFINKFPTCTVSCLIPIGSFDLSGDSALKNTATPDNTQSLISDIKDTGGNVVSDLGSVTGQLDSTNSNPDPDSGGKALEGSGSQGAKAGFSFPVFDKPASLFNLLLGGDVDLVKFDSGPLTLGFDWRQEFGPVYAPPPVLITLHGSASVTLHIVAGFDTFGIRKAFEAAKAGTLDLGTIGEAILQSLFFYTNDDAGKPLPVVSFTGELAAGAEVSVVIVTVGIEGGVGLTVSFLWNDPNHDGKFRISEFLAAALNNPICLFSVSGRLFVFLKLYVSIGIGPFSVSFSFTIVDVTLLDFSATPDCSPPPPKLGGLGDGGHTLVIYAAALGHTAQRGGGSSNPYESNNEDKDTVKITEVHDYSNPSSPTFKGIAVEMIGIRREFDNTNIDRVIVDGRGYDKAMSVTFLGDGKQDTSGTGAAPPTASFDKDTMVFGGNKDDQIKTGIGNSWVDGGPGADTIVTGDHTVLNGAGTDYLRSDAQAIVTGGSGDDAITVGNGDDIVAGDGTLDGGPTRTVTGVKELVSSKDATEDQTEGDPGVSAPNQTVPDWTQMPTPADGTGTGDGKDTIKLGLGKATAFGNAGDDTLSVSTDNALLAAHPNLGSLFHSQGATLVGGDGSDHLGGGAGDDNIFTAAQTTFGVDADGPPDAGATNVVDTGTGNDHVYGSQGIDLVTGRSQKTETDDIRGGAGNDVLIGGFGTDKVYGGPGDDNVIAEPSTVDLSSPQSDGFGTAYPVTHTDLPTGITPSAKLLVGGTGADHIIGGDGGAQVYGDGETTPCVAGSTVASDPVNEAVNTVQDGNDKITGGAGVENVRAGGGDDFVDVKANDDAACGESGNDTLIGGTGDDQVWGGSGQDVVQGDSGNDKLYGNSENDFIYGNDGTDQIEGNDGTDFASGGNGADVVIGGTRFAGRADEGDFLNGDTGQDTIIGDNGDFVGGVWVPLDLSGVPASAGGNDFIWGGDADDTCHGGIGNDTIFAGNGNDHCEGNAGNDTMFGENGEDELVGGGYEQPTPGVGYPDGVDTIDGGAQNDVITGDNAIVAGSVTPVGSSTDTVKGRGFTLAHTITLLDLGYSPTAGTSDGDVLHGGDDQDVIYGQGGNDTVTGDNGDDYAEGGPASDLISGGAGNDDIVGGSSVVDHVGGGGLNVGQPDSGDTINGDTESDVVIGDNGKVLRDPAVPPSPLTNRPGMTPQRAIVLYDLTGSGATAAAAGDDLVNGGDNVDVILGQSGNDRLLGNAGDDYAEGDQGSDAIEGNSGDDDLVGGSSTVQSGAGAATVGQTDTSDAVWGGPGDDVVMGDNALVLRTGPRTSTTDRIGTTTPATRMTSRNISLYDLNGLTPLATPAATQFGDDRLSGGSGVDVMYGQDGNDQMSGGPSDDYMEGNGGADILRGDLRLDQPPALVGEAPTTLLSTVWPGSQSGFGDLEGLGVDGQDDMMGGNSIPGFRDGSDQLEGDGESDFQLGDNGTLKRDVQGADGSGTERLYLVRYNPAAVPTNASHIRMHDPAVANAANSNNTTRFCTTAQTTCEPAGAFGDDTMWGDSGDDTMWGQDGNDTMHGGAGDDDMYGELGNDQLFGDAGEDAILGDRGGVRDVYQNGSNHFFMSVTQTPKVEFDGFNGGTVTRVTDLLHDVDGDAFVGSGTQPAMPHPGLNEGGDDRIRGGIGNDSIHAGFGDDLANGDSGADSVLGDDGADVLWGGKGCDQSVDTPASSPWCYPGGVFDPAPHLPSGEADPRAVDYIAGGKGGTSASSVANVIGSDLLDWHPRGNFVPGVGCTTQQWPVDLSTGKKGVVTTVDPCSWFDMTNLNDKDDSNNQHHQGVDWEYGGWDRDVLQADQADNGPNEGDRLLDWNGSFNLYTQCPSSNGGFNAVRQHSPTWQDFLQRWVYALGAGQTQPDAVTPGTSAFVELALVFPGADNAHGSGSAYPSTPGHFDNPNACAP